MGGLGLIRRIEVENEAEGGSEFKGETPSEPASRFLNER